MDRASDYGSEGWGFESLRDHKTKRKRKANNLRLFAFLVLNNGFFNKNRAGTNKKSLKLNCSRDFRVSTSCGCYSAGCSTRCSLETSYPRWRAFATSIS